ncbi:UNVERIFIED_CONTAM: hypothetical protein Sradi_6926400 [Sesamum radiatum]|uniref:Reverse transcriptase domain-containing protein n=1 Tax=Sesamum radiatum TaxID=300843 RepID=A0AAW2JJA1_SESRA
MVRVVKATANGFFFFEFKTVAAMEEVIEGGPWLFQGRPIILQKWTPGMALLVLGLYPDAITRACTRLDFARVCIMLDITSKLSKHIVIMVPHEDVGESPCKVDVEYEWLPPKFTTCMSLGHSTAGCPTVKPRQTPVHVYVSKTIARPQNHWEERTEKGEPQHPRPVHQPRDRARRWWMEGMIRVMQLRKSGDMRTRLIHSSVFIRSLHLSVFITVVYGVNNVVGRRELWRDLTRISTMVTDIPWLVGGDFNTVLDSSEVCGQSVDIRGAADEFQGCLQDTGLIHVPMHGERFTWHNCSRDSRSLWKRLDRLLVNDRWLGNWPDTTYVSLNARTSDHSPLVLRGDTTSRSVGMFRFDNYLARSTEFIPSVQSIWRHHIVGTAMYTVTRKLKALKQIFRAQRSDRGKVIFPPMFLWLRVSWSPHRLCWLETGTALLSCIWNSVTLTSQPDVNYEFIRYYQELLGESTRDRLIDLRYLKLWARHILTVEEAEALVLPVSPAEIKQAIFDIDETKAPGPYGYSAGFYKATWPVIGGEVTQAILEFFRTRRLLKHVNATLISLIPKVNNLTIVAEFRPISCCNVLYKAITKILVQRMRGILDTLISPSQNAFVPGRSIGDNILLHQELFSGYNQRHLPPRCALKVDLFKA